MDHLWIIYGLFTIINITFKTIDYVDWPLSIIYLVGGGTVPLCKNMKVNWDDEIPNTRETKKCSKPPTSYNVSIDKPCMETTLRNNLETCNKHHGPKCSKSPSTCDCMVGKLNFRSSKNFAPQDIWTSIAALLTPFTTGYLISMVAQLPHLRLRPASGEVLNVPPLTGASTWMLAEHVVPQPGDSGDDTHKHNEHNKGMAVIICDKFQYSWIYLWHYPLVN